MKKTPIITILFLTIFQIYGQNEKLIVRNVNVILLHINQVWNNKDVVIENGVILEIREHVVNDTTNYN